MAVTTNGFKGVSSWQVGFLIPSLPAETPPPYNWEMGEISATSALLKTERIAFESLWQDVNLEVSAGETAHVVGRNGSGKTTLLQVLSGLLPPSAGTVFWGQENIEDCPDEYRGDLMYVGHRDGIRGDMTPLENLRFAAASHCGAPLRAPEEALSLAGLSDARGFCRDLSAGQRRRTALARLLLNRARVWLLDEPQSSLDEDGRRMLDGMLDAHLHDGGCTVIATHGVPARSARVVRLN